MPQHFGTHPCFGDGTTISKVAGRAPLCAEAGASSQKPNRQRDGSQQSAELVVVQRRSGRLTGER